MGRQEQTNHLFSNRDLRILLVPLIVEQILNSLMGTADSIMVSNVGSAAISAVSLVDSINILVIQAFYALAAGGTIVCSQYIGQKDKKNAEESARQLSFVVACISSAVMAVCLLTRGPLLRLIFGSVEADVMEAAQIYFFYTALSFPFIALYDAGSSIYRAQGNTRLPMTIAVVSNGLISPEMRCLSGASILELPVRRLPRSVPALSRQWWCSPFCTIPARKLRCVTICISVRTDAGLCGFSHWESQTVSKMRCSSLESLRFSQPSRPSGRSRSQPRR